MNDRDQLTRSQMFGRGNHRTERGPQREKKTSASNNPPPQK